MPKKSKYFRNLLEYFPGIFPINFQKFGSHFGTRNARKSIKGSKTRIRLGSANVFLSENYASYSNFI